MQRYIQVKGCAWGRGGCVHVCMLSHSSLVQLCATLWTIAHQSPLFVGFSRQEYWSGWPFPLLGHLPNPGIKPTSLMSPASAGGSLLLMPPGKTGQVCICMPKPMCANVRACMCVFHARVHPNAGMFKCTCECAYANAHVCEHVCVLVPRSWGERERGRAEQRHPLGKPALPGNPREAQEGGAAVVSPLPTLPILSALPTLSIFPILSIFSVFFTFSTFAVFPDDSISEPELAHRRSHRGH